MINILLCGEGPTDQGREYCRDGLISYDEGVMQIFMRKFDFCSAISFVVKKRSDIKRFLLLPRKFEGKDHFAARKLATLAMISQCTHIAYHRDEDNQGFQAIYDQVHLLFSVAKSQGMRCIAIIPMHMTESWLLADDTSFPYIPCTPKLPTKAEEIWGSPESPSHPKKYLERVLAQYHLKPTAVIMADLANKAQVSVIQQSCPISFGRFVNDMNSFIN